MGGAGSQRAGTEGTVLAEIMEFMAIQGDAGITDAIKSDDTVYYEILVKMSFGDAEAAWVVSKRYSEFDALKNAIEKRGVSVKEFPGKGGLFGGKGDEVIEERKVGLNEFIANYVVSRAHSTAEAEFLGVKEHVRYGCTVTNTTGAGDNLTYE